MVTEALNMSLTSKREYLAKIHGRYQRAGRPHKSRILDEFCLNCGYHRKAALRLLHRPLGGLVRKRAGPKIIYDPAVLLPVLKPVWLASDQLCGKLLKPALSEFLNWALYEHLTGRKMKVPFTRSRAYRKNDNAHCEQKNWTHVRQLFGHERFEHPELVALMNDLYANEGSQFTNHFKPTFKLLKRDKRGSKTVRIYEPTPQTPYQRLLDCPDIDAASKTRLRQEHGQLDPFALKKNIERKLQ